MSIQSAGRTVAPEGRASDGSSGKWAMIAVVVGLVLVGATVWKIVSSEPQAVPQAVKRERSNQEPVQRHDGSGTQTPGGGPPPSDTPDRSATKTEVAGEDKSVLPFPLSRKALPRAEAEERRPYLTVTVCDEKRKPIKDANVRAYSGAASSGVLYPEEEFTDETGVALIRPQIPPNRDGIPEIELIVLHPDFLEYHGLVAGMKERQRRSETIILCAGRTVAGRVVGMPAEFLPKLYFQYMCGELPSTVGQAHQFGSVGFCEKSPVVDDQGNFVLLVVPTGDFVLHADADDFLTFALYRFPEIIVPAGVTYIEYTVERKPVSVGLLVAQGLPVGTKAKLFTPEGECTSLPETGSCQWQPAKWGSVLEIFATTLRAKDGNSAEPLNLVAHVKEIVPNTADGTFTIALNFSPGTHLTVRVADASTRAPIGGVVVFRQCLLERSGSGRTVRALPSTGVETDVNGTADCGSVWPGYEYQFKFKRPAWKIPHALPSVKPAFISTPGEFTLDVLLPVDEPH